MRVAFFGGSPVSAGWNGAASCCRGVIRGLHARGHRVTFYAPAPSGRPDQRDVPDPTWARVLVWEGDAGMVKAVLDARRADLVILASGAGARDVWLEEAVLALRSPSRRVAFWDVDPAATLARVRGDASDPFRGCIPRYDLVFTYGGGQPVLDAYAALGARQCVPVHDAHDPDTHHPVAPDPRFHATLGFLGDRLPDGDERAEGLFLQVARALPDRSFLLGGDGWDGVPGAPGRAELPPNVRVVGRVDDRDHNAFNCTPLAVLGVTRERVLEAAAAGACAVTDRCDDVADLFAPGEEILVADGPDEVAAHLSRLTPERARAIGDAARRRVLQQHTYDQRALEVDEALADLPLVGS